MRKGLERVAEPLYFASLIGLITRTRLLLEAGVDVNTQGGEYGNALQAVLYGTRGKTFEHAGHQARKPVRADRKNS